MRRKKLLETHPDEINEHKEVNKQQKKNAIVKTQKEKKIKEKKRAQTMSQHEGRGVNGSFKRLHVKDIQRNNKNSHNKKII